MSPVLRTGRRGLLLALALGCLGCAAARSSSSRSPQFILSAADASSALHVSGTIKGPVPGMGPSVEIEAWLRADGWLRAELVYGDDDGQEFHDTLVWTPELALLFDRRKGSFSELGDRPGELEAAGARFLSGHAIWLLLGRCPPGLPVDWQWVGQEWRGRGVDLGLRAVVSQGGDRLALTEAVWRDAEGAIHSLTARATGFESTPWGAVATELSLEGTELEGRARAEWSVESIPPLGEETFDPLWSP